jgi:hypothetical protein
MYSAFIAVVGQSFPRQVNSRANGVDRVPWVRAPERGLHKLVGVLEGSHPLVCLAHQLICTVAVEWGSENVKKADVMQVLSLDVCVSVHRKYDGSRAVRSVDPE